MVVNGAFLSDQLQALVDTVGMGSDPQSRLKLLVGLDHEWRSMMIAARDEAAYELRAKYSRADCERLTGFSNNQIAYWANRHRWRTGAPALGHRRRVNLDGAIDLSHRPVSSE